MNVKSIIIGIAIGVAITLIVVSGVFLIEQNHNVSALKEELKKFHATQNATSVTLLTPNESGLANSVSPPNMALNIKQYDELIDTYEKEIVPLYNFDNSQQAQSNIIGTLAHQLKAIDAPMYNNHPELIDNAAIATSDMVYGNENARFKLVTYGDIECPYCGKMHPHIKAVVDYSPEHVSWEYKHFPLSNHNPAALSQAAMVTCAFKEKGNQWAWLMLGELIKHTQGNGGGQYDYVEFAKHIRVQPTWLQTCANKREYQLKVESDYQDGRALGIKATPALVVIDTSSGKSKILNGFHTAEQLAKVLKELSISN